MKKKRFCIDCNRLISDKRKKYHSQGMRCILCKESYRDGYKQKWMGDNRYKYGKWKHLGCRMDRFTHGRVTAFLKRHVMHSRYEVRITFGGGERIYYDFYYGCDLKKIKSLKEKYGERQVKVMPLAKRW